MKADREEADRLLEVAIEQFGARCLWNLDRTRRSPAMRDLVLKRLRKYGGFRGWVMASEIEIAAGIRKAAEDDDASADRWFDWSPDPAFRFFPASEDPDFGWRLHDADLAVNKILAMAGRQEARDFVDVIDLHQRGYPIAALAWAAPAKDPGFTPYLILDEISRNSRIDPRQLESGVLADSKIDVVEMKRILLAANREASALFERLPPEQMGVLYLDDAMNVAMPDPAAVRSGRLHLHRASLRGAWPSIPGVEPRPPTVRSSSRRRR